MKERAARLWGWMRSHKKWSLVMLIVLIGGMWFGINGTIYLVRFGLPPPTGQNCGSLQNSYYSYYEDQSVPAGETLQQLGCFWQAYQTCHAATISQTFVVTDGSIIDTLTIEQRNKRCALYGQEVITNRGTTTFLCTQLSKQGDDLLVSECDGADPITLYARGVTESYSCGVIDTSSTKDMSQQIEECFFVAYQHCLADSLRFITSVDYIKTERDFYIDNHCGIAYWQGFVPPSNVTNLAACASLEMRADGLHFSQCGMDGDIFVPLVLSSTP